MNLVKVNRVCRFYNVRHASFFKSLFKIEKDLPPYNHIIQIGDPTLRKISDAVPTELIKSPEIQFLISQLTQVLKDYNLVGIASPQIGINLRIFLISFGEAMKEKFSPEIYKAKEMSTLPLTVFINPELKVLDHQKIVFEEGCASIVGLVAEVPRNYSVQVNAFDANGNKIEHVFKGWCARIAQHENDHLDGVLFTDLMDRKTLRNTNWEIINSKCGRIEVPYYAKK